MGRKDGKMGAVRRSELDEDVADEVVLVVAREEG